MPKVYKVWTQKDIDWCRENYLLGIHAMAAHFGVDESVLRNRYYVWRKARKVPYINPPEGTIRVSYRSNKTPVWKIKVGYNKWDYLPMAKVKEMGLYPEAVKEAEQMLIKKNLEKKERTRLRNLAISEKEKKERAKEKAKKKERKDALKLSKQPKVAKPAPEKVMVEQPENWIGTGAKVAGKLIRQDGDVILINICGVNRRFRKLKDTA